MIASYVTFGILCRLEFIPITQAIGYESGSIMFVQCLSL